MTIPLSFTFHGKHYTGELSAVHGGGVHHFHLMIGGYFYGRLRFVENEWVFDSNDRSKGFEALAEMMGEVVARWAG